MIFFIIQPNVPVNDASITTPNADPTVPWNRVGVRLAAWTEVYTDLPTFFEAIVVAALADPVCRGMLATMGTEFAIAPLDGTFLSEKSRLNRVTALFYGVLRYWCSPQIGNPQSPTPAPLEKPLTHIALWQPMLEPNAPRTGITDLYKSMRALPLATATRRAQLRIFDNILEAARAVVGEVTTSPIRRLDKLFALKLTNSPRMLARQRQLIGAYVGRQKDNFDKAIAEKKTLFTIKVCQYMAYYFGPDLCKQLNRLKAREVLGAFIAFALDDSDKAVLAPLPEAVRAIWLRLPPVARCCMLINDLRKLFEDPKSPTDVRASLALPRKELLADPPPLLWPRSYRVIRPERKTFDGVVAQGVNPRFLAAWNPDEYAEYVMTYRMNLCPLWGGASGHAVNAIHHWQEALGEKAPNVTRSVIAASLFVLWRLFYDIRISPTHTLTETFEATLAPRDNQVVDSYEASSGEEIEAAPRLMLPPPKKSEESKESDPVPQPRKPVFTVLPQQLEDAYDVLDLCRIRDGARAGAVNPIGLVRMLSRAYWNGQGFAGYDTVQQAVNRERKTLADQGYWLPRWSHDATSKVGTGVMSYVESEDPDMQPIKPEVAREALRLLGGILRRLCTPVEPLRGFRAPWALHAKVLDEVKLRQPALLESRREKAETLLRRGMKTLEVLAGLVGVPEEPLSAELQLLLRVATQSFLLCIQWLEPTSPEGRAPTVGVLPSELVTVLWSRLSPLPSLLQEAAKTSVPRTYQETLRMVAAELEQLKAELRPLLPSSARGNLREEGVRMRPTSREAPAFSPEVKKAQAAVNQLISQVKPLLQSLVNEMRSGLSLAKQVPPECRAAVREALRLLEEDELLLSLSLTPYRVDGTLARLSDDAIALKVRQLVRDLPGSLRSLQKTLRAALKGPKLSPVNRGFINSHVDRIALLLPSVEQLTLSSHDDLPQERWAPSDIIAEVRKSRQAPTSKPPVSSVPSFSRSNKGPSTSTGDSHRFVQGLDTHWYTGDEIRVLLGLHLRDVRDRVYIMEGIDAHLHQGFTLEENLRQVRAAIRDTETQCVVAPVHVGGNHWTALSLHFDLQAAKPYLSPAIHYVDPQGTRGLPETLRLSLLILFPDARVTTSTQAYQPANDEHNCGPWTVTLLAHLARHGGVLPDRGAFNIQEARTEDGRRLQQALDRP
ncbi:hypothetical protein D7X96_09255 [Corallococcus interemptor]|uniref:Uncharacterized protein n=1 Tax=Corallococcus interemptor TaxID=2316720 RepID=A0A3A8QR17_9BACT|nr:hypothetical protein [Corallococcus interemptor]RKH71219.1 hypothetical protein D7X96_09255 [Corallococcus interemptor]